MHLLLQWLQIKLFKTLRLVFMKIKNTKKCETPIFKAYLLVFQKCHFQIKKSTEGNSVLYKLISWIEMIPFHFVKVKNQVWTIPVYYQISDSFAWRNFSAYLQTWAPQFRLFKYCTVWKFQNFSVIQILPENQFWRI